MLTPSMLGVLPRRPTAQTCRVPRLSLNPNPPIACPSLRGGTPQPVSVSQVGERKGLSCGLLWHSSRRSRVLVPRRPQGTFSPSSILRFAVQTTSAMPHDLPPFGNWSFHTPNLNAMQPATCCACCMWPNSSVLCALLQRSRGGRDKPLPLPSPLECLRQPGSARLTAWRMLSEAAASHSPMRVLQWLDPVLWQPWAWHVRRHEHAHEHDHKSHQGLPWLALASAIRSMPGSSRSQRHRMYSAMLAVHAEPTLQLAWLPAAQWDALLHIATSDNDTRAVRAWAVRLRAAVRQSREDTPWHAPLMQQVAAWAAHTSALALALQLRDPKLAAVIVDLICEAAPFAAAGSLDGTLLPQPLLKTVPTRRGPMTCMGVLLARGYTAALRHVCAARPGFAAEAAAVCDVAALAPRNVLLARVCVAEVPRWVWAPQQWTWWGLAVAGQGVSALAVALLLAHGGAAAMAETPMTCRTMGPPGGEGRVSGMAGTTASWCATEAPLPDWQLCTEEDSGVVHAKAEAETEAAWPWTEAAKEATAEAGQLKVRPCTTLPGDAIRAVLYRGRAHAAVLVMLLNAGGAMKADGCDAGHRACLLAWLTRPCRAGQGGAHARKPALLGHLLLQGLLNLPELLSLRARVPPLQPTPPTLVDVLRTLASRERCGPLLQARRARRWALFHASRLLGWSVGGAPRRGLDSCLWRAVPQLPPQWSAYPLHAAAAAAAFLGDDVGRLVLQAALARFPGDVHRPLPHRLGGHTPLHVASSGVAVTLLLDGGARADAENAAARTPLESAVAPTPLSAVVGNTERRRAFAWWLSTGSTGDGRQAEVVRAMLAHPRMVEALLRHGGMLAARCWRVLCKEPLSLLPEVVAVVEEWVRHMGFPWALSHAAAV